jgi:hypothetical protein
MSSNSRELSELGGIISSDQANNQLVIATGIRFPDNTVQTTAGVAVDQYARNTANQAAAINTTQNNNIIFATNYAQAAFDKANTGSSGGLAGWTVLDNNYTVSNNIQIIANTTVSAFTITLPPSPVVGNTVVITDGSRTSVGWSNNGVTVARNGKTILGYADDLYLNVSRSTATLVYDGVTWQVSSTVGPKGDVGPAGPIGNTGPQGAGVNATQQFYRFNATNNQTIFVGADAYGSTLSYNVNAVLVHLNGVLLRPTEDYVANNGTIIYLNSGSLANDALDVITFQSMSLTAAQNTITTYVYTASAGQTSFGGADINGNSLNYNTNNLFVTLNGLTLRNGVDYLQSNSSYVALTAGAVANDELSIIAFGAFQLPGTANTISNYYYTATNGQTTFSGADAYGNSLVYNGGNLVVTRNGATLRNQLDYSATNGTSVVLNNAAYANDEIGILTFTSFNAAANAYTTTQSDSRYLNKTTNDTYTANLSATGTGFFQVPQGTTAQRPAATSAGLIRFNTSLGTLESANGTAWSNVGSGSASSGGGGISWQALQNTNFIAVAGNGYAVNTAVANVTVTLPATVTSGSIIQFLDYAGTFTSNNLIIYPNGNKINGNTNNVYVNTNGASVALVYFDSTKGWMPYSGFSSSPIGTYSVEALVIAGGGGGGQDIGGGGGAGGVVYVSSILLNPGTSYTATVGSGGAGTPNGSSGTVATNGVNSQFAGSTSAIGGGGGGSWPGGSANPGGSGGGGGAYYNASPGGAAGSGTSGQGYPGGTGGTGTSYDGYGLAGGGGGAGGAGAGNNTSPPNGGVGTSAYSDWASATGTGASGYYAGGGGGTADGNSSAGSGGLGGGGNRNTAGSPNTGGGGGGGQNAGAAGGSGIIIIRYRGAPRGAGGVISAANGFIYHTFTSSGNYIA